MVVCNDCTMLVSCQLAGRNGDESTHEIDWRLTKVLNICFLAIRIFKNLSLHVEIYVGFFSVL